MLLCMQALSQLVQEMLWRAWFSDGPFPDIFTFTLLFFSPMLLLMLRMIAVNLAEEHSAHFHSSETTLVRVYYLLLWLLLCSRSEIWNPVTAHDCFWILPCSTAVSCRNVMSRGSFLKATLSGNIENNWLGCNILQKKKKKELAFAICLRGNASISLRDISLALKHQCSSPVSGCLFSKVEPSLPKQISTWIMGLAAA